MKNLIREKIREVLNESLYKEGEEELQRLVNNLPRGYKLKAEEKPTGVTYKITKRSDDNFAKEMKDMWVASVMWNTMDVNPTHGFFSPHKIGKRLEKHFGSYWNNS